MSSSRSVSAFELATDADPRPRFEVLIADETTPAERDATRAEGLRLRAPADDFIYEFVPVPRRRRGGRDPHEPEHPGLRGAPRVQRTYAPTPRDLRETIELARAEVAGQAPSCSSLASVRSGCSAPR